MISRINLTKDSTKITGNLIHQLRLRPNITSRNALLYSMGKGDRFDNDKKVIAAANKAGITMVFTGIRHFKH